MNLIRGGGGGGGGVSIFSFYRKREALLNMYFNIRVEIFNIYKGLLY